MARITDTHTLFRELIFLTRRGARREGGNNIFGCRLAAIYRAEILRRISIPGDLCVTPPVPRHIVTNGQDHIIGTVEDI